MKIGIIGAGKLGTAIARRLAVNGIDASIANSRGPESLKELTDELGPHIKAATAQEAAAADVVFVAVKWDRLEGALKDLGPWNGRILIDANNPMILMGVNNGIPIFEPVDLGGRASSSVVAEWAPGARVVRAFCHVSFMALNADPKVAGGRRVLLLAGNDADAKNAVSDLITSLGYAPVDLGGITDELQLPRRVTLVQLDE